MKTIKAFFVLIVGCLLTAHVAKGDELAVLTPTKILEIFLLSGFAFLLMLLIMFVLIKFLTRKREEAQT